MSTNRLLHYISAFSEQERKDFGLFVSSPLFNRNTSLQKLYVYILKSELKFNKESAYQFIFEKKPFKEQRINNMMTELVHHIKDFLSFSEFRKNENQKKEALLQSLRKNQSKKNFNSVYSYFETELNELKTKDSQTYFSLYKTASEADSYMMQEGVRKKNDELQIASDNLDLFYFIEKLRLTCEMLNRKNIIGAEYDTGAADVAIKYIEERITIYKHHPAVLIYHCIFLTLKNDNDPAHFQQLKKLLNTHAASFKKNEARHMYDFAENFCIKKVNTGNTEYLTQIHSIYEQLIGSELIFSEGVISESDYKNIIAIALRLGKHEWTHNFIESYKKQLPKEQQQNAYTYNISLYFYTIKDPKNAVRALRNVEFTDVFYQLGSKLILLKIYYETEEIESFYSLIDSFKIYLHRNKKISVYQRESYSNLVRFSKNCFDLKVNPPLSEITFKIRLHKLAKNIEENKNVASLLWLRERVKELSVIS